MTKPCQYQNRMIWITKMGYLLYQIQKRWTPINIGGGWHLKDIHKSHPNQKRLMYNFWAVHDIYTTPKPVEADVKKGISKSHQNWRRLICNRWEGHDIYITSKLKEANIQTISKKHHIQYNTEAEKSSIEDTWESYPTYNTKAKESSLEDI